MAGGKETPRQKMIGMMYLVLTALLALNVSKSILDAFVSIEENIQTANITELFRGDEKREELKETAQDDTNPERAAKAAKYLLAVMDIDRMTADRIREIDNIKLQILNEIGEDVESVSDEENILRSQFDDQNPLKPLRMNLRHVNGKDKYDDPMRIMIGDDIKNPKGKGLDLWNSFNAFRKELTEKIAASQIKVNKNGKVGFDKTYYFKAPSINSYKNQKDLNYQLIKAIESSNVHLDDRNDILEIYRSLTKSEFSEVNHESGIHWMGKTFDHSPAVAAIASLSSMQKDILAARAQAISLIRSRIGGGEYSFNKIMPLAYGPEVVNQNDDFEVEVLMVAYDSDKQPVVTYEGAQITDVIDGKGKVKVKAIGNTMDLKGTVSIVNKSGVKKTMPWTKSVTVMKPAGAIEMPEFNVLYRGYKNRVIASASGFDKTLLGVSAGITKIKNGDEWIVTPTGRGRQAFLTVSGTNTSTGRTVQLKRVAYKVSNLPSPSLYCGGVKEGGRIDGRANVLIAKYGPEIPMQSAVFSIESWECEVGNSPGPPQRGNGKNISIANALIRQAPRETLITFTCKVIDPAGTRQTMTRTFRKR
ncbi:MAG: hypothetical protein MK105_11590 [Crocinitomicaceae bacterium]|nr:hypothetical protein [Crocinitomicaceae bacterium]